MRMRPDVLSAIRYYARQQCPHLPSNFVEAILNALGDDTRVDEAITTLDREEALEAARCR